MAWITLTENDALTAVNAKLLTAARTRVLADGQSDPLVDVLAQVVDLVRGKVGACRANSLGPEGTIPQKLRGPALAIFAVMILSRLDLDIEKGKQALYDHALTTLDAVAACRFDIEEPVEKTTETSASKSPRITPRCRKFRREDGDGS